MSQDKKRGRKQEPALIGQSAPAGTRRDKQDKIETTQRWARRCRLRAIAAALMAAVFLIGAVGGGSAASVNEQSIRLALGQKNYTLEGEEGPQYFDTEYKDPSELREAGAVMCRDIEEEKDRFVRLIFKFTTTIGIREIISERYILEREIFSVETPYGTVRCKHVTGFGADRIKAEYDDLARIAEEQDISIAEARELILPFLK